MPLRFLSIFFYRILDRLIEGYLVAHNRIKWEKIEKGPLSAVDFLGYRWFPRDLFDLYSSFEVWGDLEICVLFFKRFNF